MNALFPNGNKLDAKLKSKQLACLSVILGNVHPGSICGMF